MDPLTLAAIAIVALALIAAVFMLRRSWGASLSNTPRPPSAAQPGAPSTYMADTDLAQVSALLARGNKIEAIKRVRELTGLGLKEAKDYVEAMPPGVLQELPTPPLASGIAGDSGQTLAEISALMARGNKIEAIKRVRELTGLGLKEAKDYVEAMPPGVLQELPTPPLASGIAGDSGQTLAEISALMARGNKIEAIKRVRELTGLGLKESKDYVEAMEAGGDPPALPGAGAARPASEGSLAEVHALASQGQKIQAIKLYRELTGVGLKEAKDYVDRL